MQAKWNQAGVACTILLGVLMAANARATIVEFQTSLGNFQVNLYDNNTPETVANFLNYVNNGAFTDTVIHRSVPGFIVQGGGFTYSSADPANQLISIPSNPAVVNEPEFSNVRGTIAMAKLGGDPDSATNQWFFNLADNSANLDVQNGGFTAFGEVTGDGMNVVEAIAALPRYAFDAPFSDLPLRDYTSTDFTNGVAPGGDNFMIINAIIVSDSTVDSAAGLNPTPNTLIDPMPPSNPTVADSGGGGALGVLMLIALLSSGLRRVVTRRARRQAW